MYERFVKRILDILLSLAGIIVLGLPMLIIALIIKLSSPGKVFFRQRRVGAGKSYFDILKFRTMRSDTPGDVPTHMLSDPARWITPIGAFLRKTSLDELPQLFNILKGEMSVIGPRPALWNQEDLIAERDKYGANDVKPGLTGWAQINGRDELPIPVKAKLDGEYAKNISFAFDVRCFFGTIGSVARREGVVEGGTGELEKEKKHILVVSQYFYPEPFRIGDICAEWVKRGYKVTVVTGIPNYPYGKFYEGYGLFKKRRESYMGAEVIRLPIFPRGKSGLGMCLNYLSFVVSGFFWKCFTPLRADMVFCFGLSPISMALPGVWFAGRRKLPCWLYVQDLWPESVEMVTGIHSRLVIAPIDRMVRRIYRRCDRIFTTSPAYVEKIREKLTENAEKVSYWPQYAEEFYRPAERGECSLIPDDGRFKVIFTGNVGMAQGLDILPETAALLKKDGVMAEFVIVGDGRHKAALTEKIKELGTEDMFLLIPRQRAEDIPALLAQCDAAFVSFLDNDIFAATIPAKLQSYMACAMPVLACAAGETERIVKEANCGVCSPIGDAEALKENVAALIASAELKTYGKNAREYFEAHFDKKTLLDYIDGCISQELERREEV